MRYHGNPILKPRNSNSWESRFVFNTGTIQFNDKVHLFYRAMGDDQISRIGYASSSDGKTIEERLPNPIFEPATQHEKYGCEDPRITKIEERCFMAYTAYTEKSLNAYQIGLTDIKIEDIEEKRWSWGERTFPFPRLRDKNAFIFPRKIEGKYVLFHRIDPDICVAYSEDFKNWTGIKAIMHPRLDGWDNFKIGCGGPPIETSDGWLFIYHGVDFERVYRLGVVLLDKKNPEKIIYRSDRAILEPQEDYEKYGNVPNVVYSCGNVLIDDEVYIYYGAADNVICLATYELSELLP
jgi:predicted GH43/DUF377 family glycosyl hydrolase